MDYDWTNNHLNIRKQYHELKKFNNYKGLKKVVELEGFEFTGTYHRGFSDAENLAKIFIKYVDMWRY
jgi:inhibitor of KinA sporulation pathway (predicted exonuclease)